MLLSNYGIKHTVAVAKPSCAIAIVNTEEKEVEEEYNILAALLVLHYFLENFKTYYNVHNQWAFLEWGERFVMVGIPSRGGGEF